MVPPEWIQTRDVHTYFPKPLIWMDAQKEGLKLHFFLNPILMIIFINQAIVNLFFVMEELPRVILHHRIRVLE